MDDGDEEMVASDASDFEKSDLKRAYTLDGGVLPPIQISSLDGGVINGRLARRFPGPDL